MQLDTDPRMHANYPEEKGVIGTRDFWSGHPLVDGSTFDLTSTDSSMEVLFSLLELQWDFFSKWPSCAEPRRRR